MSHKQAKRDRKLYPHLHPRVKREREQQFNRALIRAFGSYRIIDDPAPVMPKDKGLLNGACNRSACLDRPATWWNSSTRAHYCAKCARLINDFCPDGTLLCTPVTQEN
jgi:hypothetical protein